MNEKGSKTVEFLTAASLLASSVSGCTSPQKAPERNIPNTSEPPIVQETPYVLPTETLKKEVFDEDINYPVDGIDSQSRRIAGEESEAPNFFVEQKDFNYEILNIADWSNYELDSIVEKEAGNKIKVTEETSMYMIPLRKDNFLKEDGEIREIRAPYGSCFEIAEVRTIVGPKKEEIKIGVIANTYGGNIVSALLLEAKDENGVSINFVNEENENSETVSYTVTEDFIYPNKVENTLIALRNIAEYQEQNGPFEKGKEYSYIEMTGIADPLRKEEYKKGLTSTRAVVKGGGVCAMATGISSLLHLQEDDSFKIKEQWTHPIRYAQGPFSQSEYLVDATVSITDDSIYDLRWEQGQEKYLSINTFLTPTDIDFRNTSGDGIGGESDVYLVVSLSFTNTPPIDQSKILQQYLNDYKEYRDSQHESRLNSMQMETNVLRHPIDEEMKSSVDLIYNMEDLTPFAKEIENNNILKDILSLQKAVNSYPIDSEISLDIYLKGTDWYKQFKDEESKKAADRILQLGTTSRIYGQPLQCVGFVMITSLLYPELSIPYVGSVPAQSARELIPEEIRGYTYKEITGWSTDYGGYSIAGKNISLEDYNPGFLFIRADGSPMANTGKPTGHIGVVIGRITKEDGRPLLLVADSNRHNDGRIRIFTVNDNSMEEVFGGDQRFLVRPSQ